MRIRGASALALGFAAISTAAAAGTDFIDLGPSTQNYVLYGQGAYSPGLGSFTNQQGSESTSGGIVTDTLSGTITGATNPLYAYGTYAFVTTYSGTPIGSGGMEIQAQSNPSDPNQFFYSFFDPTVDMTLYLFTTLDGTVKIPLVTDASFNGPGFGFAYTSATCTGVALCTQNNVGLTPGSSIFGPVTITISYTAVPEPAGWALMLVGAGLVGGVLRLARRGDRGALA
jgi:hypothetical protein